MPDSKYIIVRLEPDATRKKYATIVGEAGNFKSAINMLKSYIYMEVTNVYPSRDGIIIKKGTPEFDESILELLANYPEWNDFNVEAYCEILDENVYDGAEVIESYIVYRLRNLLRIPTPDEDYVQHSQHT